MAAGIATFVALGAMQSMYGPAFPSLQQRFGVTLDVVGWIVSAHFAGSFVSVLAMTAILGRFGYRVPMVVGSLIAAAGAVIVATEASYAAVFTGAAAIGLGFGAIDVALTLWVARAFREVAASVLNLMNAFFGIGAVLGPLAVAGLAGGLRGPMVLLTALLVAIVATVWALRDPDRPNVATVGGLRWSALAGFVLVFFTYVTVEVGVGSWETTHLAPTLGAQAAAAHAAAYWGFLALGRLVAVPVAARLAPATLVLGSAVVATVGLALAHVAPIAWMAYPLVGFALGPIFPTCIAWLTRDHPEHAERMTPLVLAAATLGPVATSGAIGAIVERAGATSVPTIMTALSLAMVVAVVVTRATSKRPQGTVATTSTP